MWGSGWGCRSCVELPVDGRRWLTLKMAFIDHRETCLDKKQLGCRPFVIWRAGWGCGLWASEPCLVLRPPLLSPSSCPQHLGKSLAVLGPRKTGCETSLAPTGNGGSGVRRMWHSGLGVHEDLFPAQPPGALHTRSVAGALGISKPCCRLSFYLRETLLAWCRWLTPVILATQEAEIRRIMVW
jgi:hypothetical protein